MTYKAYDVSQAQTSLIYPTSILSFFAVEKIMTEERPELRLTEVKERKERR
jgi:hypothetical protein